MFHLYEPLRVLLTEAIVYLQTFPYQLWTPGKPAIWLVCLAFVSVLTGLYFFRGTVLWKIYNSAYHPSYVYSHRSNVI